MNNPEGKFNRVEDTDPFEDTTARSKKGDPINTQVDFDDDPNSYFTKTRNRDNEVLIIFFIFIWIKIIAIIYSSKSYR